DLDPEAVPDLREERAHFGLELRVDRRARPSALALLALALLDLDARDAFLELREEHLASLARRVRDLVELGRALELGLRLDLVEPRARELRGDRERARDARLRAADLLHDLSLARAHLDEARVAAAFLDD